MERQQYEHCRLTGNKIQYLGRVGLFEDRSDQPFTETRAWDFLEQEGWELVSVIVLEDSKPVHYFKRPVAPKKK
jgi:hypothetical protein